MPKLDSADLILGSRLCPWSPTVALHVSLNSGVEAALMCLDSLRLPSFARNPHIDSEIVEGPVVQGVELKVSIEEDPSEAEYDAWMLLELEGVAPVDAEGIDTLAAGGSLSPLPVPLFCGCCLWSEQQVEATSQQMAGLREEIREWMPSATRLARDSVERAHAQLDSRLGGSGSRHPQTYVYVYVYRNVSDSRSSNHADEVVSESFQSRQLEPIRENTRHPEQATHTQLKLPQERRWQIERLYRGRQLLAQLQPPINVLDKDYGSLEIPRDPMASKGSEMKAGEPKPLEEYIDARNQDIPRTGSLRCNKYLRRSPEKQVNPRLREEPQKEGVIRHK
ncbi:hypothetical protein M9H77_22799 [Catharanthus roseus]|uniref:Uncharacterized protein n=1 Tax=Catharanthus roseus TaxID=4058 RepID=A0ACC0ARW3_CATRO|nr:hypothetical protein M9H77_22799 [Catharanthus roseus]